VDEEEEDDDEEEAQPQRRTKRAADGTQKSKANGQAKQGTKRVANGHTEAVVVDGADGIKTDCPLFSELLSIAYDGIVDRYRCSALSRHRSPAAHRGLGRDLSANRKR